MTTSTMGSIITAGTTAISDHFGTVLPYVIPVAVGLAVLFGVIHFFFGSARRK